MPAGAEIFGVSFTYRLRWLHHLLRRVRQRSPHQLIDFAEAFLLLGIARISIAVLPTRRLLSWSRCHRCKTHSDDAEQEARIERLRARVSWAVTRAARYTPWDSKCLAQALAAKWILKRYGVGAELFFGVARDDQSKLIAHAWLVQEGQILTGGEGHEQYVVVHHIDDRSNEEEIGTS